jgi:hypothetical protein
MPDYANTTPSNVSKDMQNYEGTTPSGQWIDMRDYIESYFFQSMPHYIGGIVSDHWKDMDDYSLTQNKQFRKPEVGDVIIEVNGTVNKVTKIGDLPHWYYAHNNPESNTVEIHCLRKTHV